MESSGYQQTTNYTNFADFERRGNLFLNKRNLEQCLFIKIHLKNAAKNIA